MAPKKQTPPPIDRPLSKAYLRQFAGWSTAYPPGQSEPTSCRVMENVWVNRNGAMEVRPGLHHLSYLTPPDRDPLLEDSPGTAMNLPVVGAPELFFLSDGSRALLIAVRETSGKVGFRAVMMSGTGQMVRRLTDPEIGFAVPQGEDVLEFTEDTTHVQYLQINNRILALSDNAETARLFIVGGKKIAKRLQGISVPTWKIEDKLTVVHPDDTWITARASTFRRNLAVNPSFQAGFAGWTKSPRTGVRIVQDAGGDGGFALEVYSLPERTNMVTSPLHDVATYGVDGWHAGEPTTSLLGSGGWMTVASSQGGRFTARSAMLVEGVEDQTEYRVSLDIAASGAEPEIAVTFYTADGSESGTVRAPVSTSGGTWVSPAIRTPLETVTVRLSIGGRSADGTPGSVRVRNVLMCKEGEDTAFFSGSSGTGYTYWTGGINSSASVVHPPIPLWVRSAPQPNPSTSLCRAGLAVRGVAGDSYCGISVVNLDNDMVEIADARTRFLLEHDDPWRRVSHAAAAPNREASTVNAAFKFDVEEARRGNAFRIDAALLEPDGPPGSSGYFDGSTASTTTAVNSWDGPPHEGTSTQQEWVTAASIPVAQTPVAETLIATGGDAANPHKIGVFYTFENEVGESAPSRITEARLRRPWSNWSTKLPNADGTPGTATANDPAMSADQLVFVIPQGVYDQAIAEGALRVNLYAFNWSDQQAVPTVAQLVAYKDLQTDPTSIGTGLPYAQGGWIQVTPQRRAGIDDALLPTIDNRVNYSMPPDHSNGTVAGDRMILVGSPSDPASITWSSSRPGKYTNFSANSGGGLKTLSSGNLNVPYAVLLWQNPQSVDTLSILCSDDNGKSASYYMAPAQVTSQSTGSLSVMGFEETTSTPGTVAPFGAEVMNNALYRPLDQHLLKTTAQNYNINHKTMTDMIANMWRGLQSKRWIMSATLDNRMYYLVHNPLGELLLPHCKGNEIWVYDLGSEAGSWSRFLIQGSALKVVNVGTSTFMSVSRPDGLYYLDTETKDDAYVVPDGTVLQRPIPWMFETNTQGANRAHDAWAHLQQASVTLGSFEGQVRWGIHGYTLHGAWLDIEKTTEVPMPGDRSIPWGFEDALQVRRDLKEWYFRAESLPGVRGAGSVQLVQYRYTPTTVNVGYEHGSVETFEYGAAGTDFSRNGVPQPFSDAGRSWV